MYTPSAMKYCHLLIILFALSTPVSAQTFKPLDVLGIQMAGCNADREGELIFMYTSCGFAVDSLVIDLDSTYGVYSNRNDYFINQKNEVCKWKPGDLTVFEECDNLFAVGAGEYIPPRSMVVIQMTADIGTISSLRGECDLGIPIYVIANDCIRTDEAFPIHGVGKDSFGIDVTLLPDVTWSIARYSVTYAPDQTVFDRPLNLFSNYPGEWGSFHYCDTHYVIDFAKHIKALYPDLVIQQPTCNSNGRIEFPFKKESYSIDGGATWSNDSIFEDLASGMYQPTVWDDQANCAVVWPYPVSIDSIIAPQFMSIWWRPLPDTICQGRTADLYIDFRLGPDDAMIDTSLYEFSIDSGRTFQDSWKFLGLVEAGYNLVIREKDHPECTVHQQWRSPSLEQPPNIIGLAMDSVGYCYEGTMEIQATGSHLLFSTDGINYDPDSVVVLDPDRDYVVYVKESGNSLCIDSLAVRLGLASEFIPEIEIDGRSASFYFLKESKGPYTFRWSTGDTTATVDKLPIGLNYLDITDGWGCTQRLAFHIEDNDCVFHLTDSIVDATCETPTTSIYLVSTDTTNQYTYDWSIDSFDGLPYIENVAHGTFSVEVSYGVCTKEINYITPVGGIRSVEYTTDPTKCNGDLGTLMISKVVGGQGPYQIDLTGEQFDSNLTIASLSQGVHRFSIVGALGCVYQDSFEILAEIDVPVVEPRISFDCDTELYTLDLSTIRGGLAPYQLRLNNTPSAGNIIDHLAPGSYKIEILDASGCSSGIIPIELIDDIIFALDPDTTIEAGAILPLHALGNLSLLDSYYWEGPEGFICDCSRIDIRPDKSGTYVFHYITKSGCEQMQSIQVDILQTNIFIPNSFTPNGDNLNDDFKIYAPNHEILTLQIFNRWGDKVFSAMGTDFIWDGQSGNSKAAPGVYIYQAILQAENGKTQQEAGSVTLIR